MPKNSMEEDKKILVMVCMVLQTFEWTKIAGSK